VYLLPCIGIYVMRGARCALGPIFCCLCRACGCYYYEDKEFTGQRALGEKRIDVDWVRADELDIVAKDDEVKHIALFHGIEPEDLCQGALGDCWLVAGLACLAEYPGAIRKVFRECEYNDVGKYHVRLWDGRVGKWVTVTVDDRIPVKPGTKETVFMHPNGCELWAILLEKAFAKFVGSYGALDGGLAVWAWHAMTGDNVYDFKKRPNGSWIRRDLVFLNKKKGLEARCDVGYLPNDDEIDEEDFFGVLLKYSSKGAVLGAARMVSGAEREEKNSEGLVAGHQYSILDVRRVGTSMVRTGGRKMIKLRNPWGTFEWKGAWSDGSREWDDHPKIKKELEYEDSDDGSFWMEYKDFADRFNSVDVCDRTTTTDLVLDVREADGCLGPTKACVGGCGFFWCMCGGCSTIFCGNKTSSETETKAGCCTTK